MPAQAAIPLARTFTILRVPTIPSAPGIACPVNSSEAARALERSRKKPMPALTDNKARRVAAFLGSDQWQIAPDRGKTRQALSEVLLEPPDEILALIVRILVIAPSRKAASITCDFKCPEGARDRVTFAVVFFDSRMEIAPYADVRRIVRERMASAFARLSGLSNTQANAVAKGEAAMGRPC
jgi:hypothetical protein